AKARTGGGNHFGATQSRHTLPFKSQKEREKEKTRAAKRPGTASQDKQTDTTQGGAALLRDGGQKLHRGGAPTTHKFPRNGQHAQKLSKQVRRAAPTTTKQSAAPKQCKGFEKHPAETKKQRNKKTAKEGKTTMNKQKEKRKNAKKQPKKKETKKTKKSKTKYNRPQGKKRKQYIRPLTLSASSISTKKYIYYATGTKSSRKTH
ncbi:hypothetical protein MOQ_007545, partial [Trypanosoma cruzi marinkellei]